MAMRMDTNPNVEQIKKRLINMASGEANFHFITNGATILHCAVINNDPECVEHLIKVMNYDVHSRCANSIKDTPLHLMFTNDDIHKDIIDIFMNNGFDVNCVNAKGNSIFHTAILQFEEPEQCDDILELIQKYNFNISQVIKEGMTILDIAAANGNYIFTELLVNICTPSMINKSLEIAIAERCDDKDFLLIQVKENDLSKYNSIIDQGNDEICKTLTVYYNSKWDKHTIIAEVVTNLKWFNNTIEILREHSTKRKKIKA